MDAPQSLPELRAKLVQLKADLNQADAELRGTTAGTPEFGERSRRQQQLTNDYDRTQRLIKALQTGRQSSLL